MHFLVYLTRDEKKSVANGFEILLKSSFTLHTEYIFPIYQQISYIAYKQIQIPLPGTGNGTQVARYGVSLQFTNVP